MKKIIEFFKNNKAMLIALISVSVLLVGLVIFLVINSINDNNQNTNSGSYISVESEKEQIDDEELEKLESLLKSNLPRMDGSTSTIPLEAGIKAALFGISQESAEASVVHSTTYGSFDNLIAGNCDIIFSTPLSQEQYNKAKEANITLVETPVVYEGFVFVVNASNPVDTLTQKHLKDIYSGKITNWKQVGGNDAPIVAYQRNETSGSQNYMKAFMKDSNLMKPLTTITPGSMGELMDAVAHYDNSENAIGYSVYAYAANMYGNGNEIKFIKVDGVEPTRETMAAQKYPLLNYNYAIYNKASEADTAVDELTRWLLTDNGQLAMVNAGYVPIRNVKIKELKIEPYTSKGTSNEKKAELSEYYSKVEMRELLGISSTDYHNIEDPRVKITTLKNKALENKINKFIEESVEKLEPLEPECENYVKLLNKSGRHYFGFGSEEGHEYYLSKGINTELNCINGYLSVAVSLKYSYEVQDGFEFTYKGYSKIYDLYSGKDLGLSDLFYKNENFVDVINTQIKERIPYEVNLSILPIEEKRPYAALTKDCYNISLNRYGNIVLTFDKENPYFAEGVDFEIETYDKNISCVTKSRDMQGIFSEDVKIYKYVQKRYVNSKIDEKTTAKCEYHIYYFDSQDAELNSMVNEYIDKNLISDAYITALVEKRYGKDSKKMDDWESSDGKHGIDISAGIYGNKYVVIEIYNDTNHIGEAYLDMKTGNSVSEKDFKVWHSSISPWIYD